MSRRQIDYDYDDYCDDAYYYEEEEEEAAPSGEASAYMWQSSPAPADDQAGLLDTLAHEFRALLSDASLTRDAIDAALVASDYDVEAAVSLMRSASAADAAARAASAARLEGAPSAMARAVGEGDEGDVARMPEAAVTPVKAGAPAMFLFDSPSPDDVVRQQRADGETRAQGAARIKKGLRLPGGTVDLGRAKAKRVEAKERGEAKVVAKAREESLGGGGGRGGVGVKRGQGGEGPKQRARAIKFPTAAKLAARAPSVAIVVAGHVDAGKSTLVGHILRLVGEVSVRPGRTGKEGGRSSARRSRPGDALAWMTDEDAIEQERGVTIDIATRVFRSPTSKKLFTMIDAPGHRDYVPAMILGACQASAAILVVDASVGEFESGFSEEGQTREHAVLLRSLGVARLVVVLNKMDMVGYAQARYDGICEELSGYLKNLGWKSGKDVVFIPASAALGVNLVDRAAEGTTLASWYTGDTIMGALEALPTARSKEITVAMAQPTRLVVSDAYRSSTLGGVIAVSGRLVSGTVAAKDTLRLCPTTESAVVKAIEVGSEVRGGDSAYAVAAADSLPVSIGLTGIADTTIISAGDVLCDPQAPVPTAARFRAQVLTLATPVPLVQGVQVELHLGGVCEAAVISKLVELKTGAGAAGEVEGKKKKAPRMLVKGAGAIVELTVSRPICVERAVDAKFLGRFALRSHGKTVAAGVVTKVLKPKKVKAQTSVEGGSVEVES